MIRATILELCEKRYPATICPSEVARHLSEDEATWRAMMPQVRDVANEMARARLIEITQKNVVLDLAQPYAGAIRLRLVKA